MKFTNLSSIPGTRFALIIQFLEGQFALARHCMLEVRDYTSPSTGSEWDKKNHILADSGLWATTGRASLMSDGGHVTLWLSKGLRYPFNDPYRVPGIPQATFANWDEEVLYVLAHEMEHIEQLAAGRKVKDEAVCMEQDAEKKAAYCLSWWRLMIKNNLIMETSSDEWNSMLDKIDAMVDRARLTAARSSTK